MEKISVIVAVYNSSKYLRKCIESIIKQTYQNLEIILVNDGSTDNSGDICEEYAGKDERIVVIHQPNIGGGTRNRGLEICTGNYIGFVDADDWIAEDMYEFLLEAILKYNADISVCGHYRADEMHGVYGIEHGGGETFVYNGREAVGKVVEDRIIHSYVWDKLFRKEMFEKFRFKKGVVLEDIASMYKIFMQAQKVVVCNIPKYYYYQRKDSVLHSRDDALNWNQFSIYKERLSVLEKDYPELRERLVVDLVSFGIGTYNCFLLKEQLSQEEKGRKKEILYTIQKYAEEVKRGKYGSRGLRCRLTFMLRKSYDEIYPKMKIVWKKIYSIKSGTVGANDG